MIRFVGAAGLVVAAATAAVMLGSAEGQQYDLPREVSVYPAPGVISASPSTQLSFRGRRISRIGKVSVTGSRSGRHAGRLRAHSDGNGASWIPSRRFSGGETVTVRTGLPIRGARSGDFRFRVGRIRPHDTVQKRIHDKVPRGRLRSFRSRPDLEPPLVRVEGSAKQTEPGYVFLSPKSKQDLVQAGPMIVDNAGRLVYFRPLRGIRAGTDFRAQVYKGKPVLTYWEGTSRVGIGVGELVILDQAYREIKRIRAPNGFRPDLHEFVITEGDRALLLTFPIVRADLRRVGGPRNGLVVDSVIQEVDIETGLVVFEWHSLGNVALAETYSRPDPAAGVPFDYAHANSVTLDADGDLLLSARNTWAVYKIDRVSGRIVWRLGGKRSDYKLGRGARFAWQHDAQRRADGAITIFDNSASPPVRRHSRALALRLDDRAKRATVLSAYTHPRGLLAATQGNVQNLPGGGSFVGWGSQRWFNEFDERGRIVWNARVPLGFESYRGYRLPWVGRPATRPRAAAIRASREMDVYASWNGATEVRSWEVLTGPTPKALWPAASAARAGFETRIRVRRARYAAVRALDAAGTVLSTSPATRLR